ncbi:sensor histidine kinase [Sphingomonas alpina]|uniref:sensor histidine kinase n=1 Tax=Sphingomonas alpina TaxID=653931 RepID=UPI0021BAD33D|nr:ATP-binding protein [Sphingomonas alpina]
MRGWRRALAIILGVQLLFWGAYALIVAGLQPAGTLELYRLPAARALLASEQGQSSAFAAGLSGPALLRIPGWQPVILYPARASLLTRDETATGIEWSLTCLENPCPKAVTAYAGPFDPMDQAADWEKFLRFDMVWLVVATEIMMGAALLVLLPVNRFSRLQGITGLLLILVGVDAWLTTFGALSLPYGWFPLLRYGTEYLMLTMAALAVNGFVDWRPREAWAACGCFIVVFTILLGTMIAGASFAAIVPWLDAITLTLLLGYGVVALLRMGRTAPGPAIRVLAILLVALASIAFDLFLLPPPTGFALQASVLAPPLTMFGILFEIALQGHRLNQEAEEARSDLERQVLEQDASLLRSSQLLRHQERLIAIDAERQRLLRDMHDGVGGVLTHLLLDVRENRLTAPEIEQGLQSAVDDLRNMASAIDAGNEPIDEALAMFRERMVGRLVRSGIALDYRCTLPIPAPSLDVRRLLSLYRLLQEGIANTLRHASATRIDLAVEQGDDGAILVILSDDGTGFEPDSAAGAAGEGRGLANMRHRAAQMGGRLGIESAAGLGTQLTLAIPIAFAAGRKA